MRVTIAAVAILLALALAPASMAAGERTARTTAAATTSAYTSGDLPCRQHTRRVSGWSLTGRRLWSYFQRVRFCYTGSPWVEGLRYGQVVNITRVRWGETYALGWDYDPMDATGWCSADRYDCHRFSQGKFRLCASACVQTKTPWVRHDMFGNGRMGVRIGG